MRPILVALLCLMSSFASAQAPPQQLPKIEAILCDGLWHADEILKAAVDAGEEGMHRVYIRLKKQLNVEGRSICVARNILAAEVTVLEEVRVYDGLVLREKSHTARVLKVRYQGGGNAIPIYYAILFSTGAPVRFVREAALH